MAIKLYGSLNNRFDENHNFTGREIRVGDDITKYHWSDRTCYFVTKVIDQTHIFIHPYHVCADHSKAGGMGHQDWLYFKTVNEEHKYLNSCHLMMDGKEVHYSEQIEEPSDTELVLYRGHWCTVSRFNLERWEIAKERAKEELREGVKLTEDAIRWFFDRFTLTDKQFAKVMAGKEVCKYDRFGNISFGTRDYYYDWEF